MDTSCTMLPEHWQEMTKLRGRPAMEQLAAWFEKHIGLPLRAHAQPGAEAVVVRAATITAGHLVCEMRQVTVSSAKAHAVEALGAWETRGFPLVEPPPFWVQRPLSL